MRLAVAELIFSAKSKEAADQLPLEQLEGPKFASANWLIRTGKPGNRERRCLSSAKQNGGMKRYCCSPHY
jgi:hypothetical protein